jgi:threonine aldolase
MFPISFGSDNHSGVHYRVFSALQKANVGFCPAYGDDPLSQSVLSDIESLFGGDCSACFVMTGTGANVLSLQSFMRSYHAIACAATSHINVDECGAVQKFTQGRLQPIPTPDGKLTPELIAPMLFGNRDQHHSQFHIVSITQSTEYGTVYSLAEIHALADFAHEHGMYLHIDGARLANAAAALNCSLKEMTVDQGADIISFGGTKNGLLFGEAVISFRPVISSDIRFYRKQATQLFSKMRFIAAQYEAYLACDLWLENARMANTMTAKLAEGLSKLPGITITQDVVVNSVFAVLPRSITPALQDKYHFYMWDETRNEVRLMCSFNTLQEHVDEFLEDVRDRLKAAD